MLGNLTLDVVRQDDVRATEFCFCLLRGLMNPLRSTSTQTSFHADAAAALAAVTQPYQADLKHFLALAEERDLIPEESEAGLVPATYARIVGHIALTLVSALAV